MPQVSIYLDQSILDKARHNARMVSVSLSKYVSQALENTAETDWPESFWSLFGALDDDSFVIPDDTPLNQVPAKELF